MINDMSKVNIAIVGPTACGKTRRAVQLARIYDAEIVSADSRQIYRGMDIGTGKDIEEYGDVPVHLIDICDAGERYNLHRYITDARRVLDEIASRSRRAIICGGSGMYIENLLSGIILPDVPRNDELRNRLSQLSLSELTQILSRYKKLHNTTDVDNPRRAIRAIEIAEWYVTHPDAATDAYRSKAKPSDAVVIGLEIDRESRRKLIDRRLRQRLANGMIDEARRLLANGLSHEDLMYYGLEYKYMSLHLQGVLTLEEMTSQLETAIHQFAKRQMTWLRGMERRGFTIHWLPYNLPEDEFIVRARALIP